MRNEFMQFKKLDDNTTELYIYGDIRRVGMFERVIAKDFDEEVDATSAITFKDALKEVKTDTLLVRINSGGGSVAEALAIYSQLQDFEGKIITKVDGIAASAASVIFMAGEERIVPNSGLLMIHNAWTYAEGNANELRKMADDLDKITQPSIDIYVEKTGQNEETIKALMDNETWITSKEALELGFATETVKEDKEMSYQQNALLSLVQENKRLKEQLENVEQSVLSREQVDLIANMIIDKINVKEDKEEVNQEETNSWEGFFNRKKEI